jgi:hypothetical protein
MAEFMTWRNKMRLLKKIVIFFILSVSVFTCKEREPINPLDPDNHNTKGQAYTIQANATGIGKVKLHWRKVNEPRVKSYSVYRTSENEAYAHIVDVTDTLFLDTQLLPDKTYSYFYRLIWEDGREIHESPTADVITFNAPTGLTITNVSRNRVEMRWNDLRWLDNYAYCRIYRNSGGEFSIYDSTLSNQYVDTHVNTGITYRYKLIAVGTEGNSSNSSNEGYATPGNHSPVIDSLKPSRPFTNWGEQVSITCYVHDEDNDPITYFWEASDGGTISGSGRTITFEVPKDSVMTHRVRATVTDAYSVGNQDTVVIESSDSVLSENFEDSMLDPRITIQTIGTFNQKSGIYNITNFGSAKAFGFGRSTCGASCFDYFVTNFKITLPESTFISSISFKEMELYGNWGSEGKIYIDGNAISSIENQDFGRQPINDGQADGTYRSRQYPLNRFVTTVELRVTDITNSSEIFIDDLSLHR